jgi:hypothetical protein
MAIGLAVAHIAVEECKRNAWTGYVWESPENYGKNP